MFKRKSTDFASRRKHVEATTKLKIFIGTWNMARTAPPDHPFNWVPREQYDLCVIGVQECDYQPSSSTCEQDWLNSIQQRIGTRSYQVLKFRSLWQTRLVVLARTTLVPFVTAVHASEVKTGVGEIGRAVQQECRDRSRMPSSA
eukprot:TRINITY_DN6606_c0_g1_i5.p1 TRINITY_DN6606_c0_g1~~TRINITY_DN6606_c0_g1_i5.p1  ORF type:complete len:144 (+),score=16.95 TRINITY_DN6606_c0_g1_i5:89-520(+)